MLNPLEKKEYLILFVEDDAISRKLFLQFADSARLPYIISVAETFEEAKTNLQKSKFDVVISDYFLGDGIGIELVPYLSDAPLLIITGAGDEETAINSLKSGASDYIIKGNDHSYLKKLNYVVESALNKKYVERMLSMHSQAIQNINDSIFFINTNNKFIYVNKAFGDIYGYASEEILNQNIGIIWEGKRNFSAFLDKKFSGEYVNQKKDGRLFPVLLSYTPITQNGGQVFAAVGIARDITDQKRIQNEIKKHSEQLEKLVEDKTKEMREYERFAAIGETAAMVGHDLRNPLQVLVNTIYIAKLKLNKVKLNKTVNPVELLNGTFGVMDEQIEYMNKIVSDLQDYAKNIKPDINSINVKEFFEKLIGEYANYENINYHLDIDDSAVYLFADKALMQRVMINLLTNSKNAIEKKGDVKIMAQKIKGNFIISIEDNGVGIDENSKTQLFKPLFTTRAKGTGMGLSVCKRIIDAHNGSISIESILGRGTKVIIILPQDN